jgi:hypothetical protein
MAAAGEKPMAVDRRPAESAEACRRPHLSTIEGR